MSRRPLTCWCAFFCVQAASAHYEDPNTPSGCASDEQKVQITGIAGDICTPACGANNTCPTDVPPGVTAKPTCALHDQSGNGYCALVCTPSMGDAQCGKNASCKAAGQGQGLCTYDDIPPPPSSKHWKPVNSPTFEALGVVIDVAFEADGKTGYAGAGSNGVGAQIVKSEDSGVTWNPVWPTGPNATAFNIFLASVVKSNTSAVVAGALFRTYTTDGNTFQGSTNGLMSPAQGGSIMANGDYALVGPQGSQNGYATSTDGKTWTPVDIGVNASLFPARYGSFPDSQNFYVTAGLFPNTGAGLNAPGSRRVTHRVAVDNEGSEMHVGDNVQGNGPTDCKTDPGNCFSASIVKSSDGGKTWRKVFEDINTGHNIYPNGIDCISAEHCVAVLEGDTARILVTTDGGETWNETMHDTDSASSLMAVHMISDKEVWVSGGHMDQADFEGRFWHSTDGGMTWVKEAIPDLYIISFDMISADSGFAVALTLQSGVELLKYDANGDDEATPVSFNM